MPFRFKQFTVEDARSTLRVGTDAMVLGSWANPSGAMKILDIGTGCGVLALMMAQKSGATVDAIDIDEPSVAEAQMNFSNSPWPGRIKTLQSSLQEFSLNAGQVYDFILTNPPYFSNSLKSPVARQNLARHDASLSLPELVRHTGRLLSAKGLFSVILPFDQGANFRAACEKNGLHLNRTLTVLPKPASPPKRIVMEFGKLKNSSPVETELTILGHEGKFTAEYLALTGCFHNF
jgi:tRNA1Val (adenine37-N6)-methyltransferase